MRKRAAKALFAEYDMDEDKKLTYDEFQELIYDWKSDEFDQGFEGGFG